MKSKICKGLRKVLLATILVGSQFSLNAQDLSSRINHKLEEKFTENGPGAVFLVAKKGDIIYKNEDITGIRADSLVKKGIGYVPQIDNVFPSLTVEENLQMGGLNLSKIEIDERIGQVYDIFLNIKQKPYHLAESLSGGERQMLAISRVLISNPSFIKLSFPDVFFSYSAFKSTPLSSTFFCHPQIYNPLSTCFRSRRSQLSSCLFYHTTFNFRYNIHILQ